METRSTGVYDQIVEVGQPTHCTEGHEMRPPNVGVGWRQCSCAGDGGHRTFTCRTCHDVIYMPDHDGYDPPAYRG